MPLPSGIYWRIPFLVFSKIPFLYYTLKNSCSRFLENSFFDFSRILIFDFSRILDQYLLLGHKEIDADIYPSSVQLDSHLQFSEQPVPCKDYYAISLTYLTLNSNFV